MPSPKKKTTTSSKSPIAKTILRNGIVAESFLHGHIADGLGAVQGKDKDYFHESIKVDFVDSLDLDAAMLVGHEGENRWDYLLGHGGSKRIIGVEPHSAKTDQISTVIQKRKSAREQLRDHLKDGVQVAKWLWVASGKVHFANTEKAKLILDQNGIEFAGGMVCAKHLA